MVCNISNYIPSSLDQITKNQKQNENKTPSPLFCVPNDILNIIFLSISLNDIHSVTLVCKKFATVIDTDGFWKAFVKIYLFRNHFPLDVNAKDFMKTLFVKKPPESVLCDEKRTFLCSSLTNQNIILLNIDSIPSHQDPTEHLLLSHRKVDLPYTSCYTLEIHQQGKRKCCLLTKGVPSNRPHHFSTNHLSPVVRLQWQKEVAWVAFKEGKVCQWKYISKGDEKKIELGQKINMQNSILAAAFDENRGYLSIEEKIFSLSTLSSGPPQEIYEGKKKIVLLESSYPYLFGGTDEDLLIWKEEKLMQTIKIEKYSMTVLHAAPREGMISLFVGHRKGKVSVIKCFNEIESDFSFSASEEPINGLKYIHPFLFVFSTEKTEDAQGVFTVTVWIERTAKTFVALHKWKSLTRFVYNAFIQASKLHLFTSEKKFSLALPSTLQVLYDMHTH